MNRPHRPSQLTGTQIADCDVYVVECRAKDGSLYFPERDAARTNRTDTIWDIYNGEETGAVRVISFNVATFSCADVTKDVMAAVEALREVATRHHPRDFLEAPHCSATVREGV